MTVVMARGIVRAVSDINRELWGVRLSLARIELQLYLLTQNGATIMSAWQDLVTQVHKTEDQQAAAATAYKALLTKQAEILAKLAALGDAPTGDQVAALSAELQASSDQLSAAVATAPSDPLPEVPPGPAVPAGG